MGGVGEHVDGHLASPFVVDLVDRTLGDLRAVHQEEDGQDRRHEVDGHGRRVLGQGVGAAADPLVEGVEEGLRSGREIDLARDLSDLVVTHLELLDGIGQGVL